MKPASVAPSRRPRILVCNVGVLHLVKTADYQGVPPTPETMAKRRWDPIRWMERRGYLPADQVAAANGILEAWEMVTADVGVRQYTYAGNMPGRGYMVLQDWTNAQIEIASRYRYWRIGMRGNRWPISPVLDIVCHGLTCRETDTKRRRSRGWARMHLGRALELYLKINS